MATGFPAAESTEQSLVNSLTGVTARIDSLIEADTPIHIPATAEATPTQPSKQDAPRTSPAPFRCTLAQRAWMRTGQAFGIVIPMSLAIATITPLYFIAISVINSISLPALTAQYTIIGCVAVWMLITVITSSLAAPFLSPSFGYRIRRSILPIDVMPDSMHRLFLEMRMMILGLVLCQTGASALGYYCLSNADPMQMWAGWQPVLFGSSLFLAMGITVLVLGHEAFLHTRGRKVRRWLSKCWRGVALRSFIPAWDNQRRPIFDSCRASRRLAAAYRSIKMGAASCFAAAGCLAAMTVGDSIIGIVFVAASVIGTVAVWPTANRIVDWSKTVIDPITGDLDDE